MPEPMDQQRGRDQPSDDKAAERLRQFEQERGLAPVEGEEQEDPPPKEQDRRSERADRPPRQCDDEEAK